ncbi:hypothetical protein Ocin01_06802 [Orchesella cincta]|uniref:Uncharacterized protein n=1 Tax=Orchesella cincta TaxID=48709 RepID=A0A1D2N3S0_ORCCI|nr:hypothetical protein Ocin01_06802 [Orchesella cincta]
MDMEVERGRRDRIIFIGAIIISSCFAVADGWSLKKSDLFLLSPVIHGDPPNFGGIQLFDPTDVRTSGTKHVLYGHYSTFLENREHSSDPSKTLSGRSLMGKRTPVKSEVATILDAYSKNLRQVLEKAKSTMNAKKSETFTKAFDRCEKDGTFGKCKLIPALVSRCGAHCLAEEDETVKGLIDLIIPKIEHFCQPLDTIFDTIFDDSEKKSEQFKRLIHFLQPFRAAKQMLADVTKGGAAALVPIIINKVPTSMQPLRLVTKEIEMAISAVESLEPSVDSVLYNRLCSNIDDRSAMTNLIDVLYRDPSLIDILLTGLTSMNLVSKYIPGSFQTPFAATSEAIRMLTGRTCGLIPFSESGNAVECDEFGGYPTPGTPLPPLPGIDADASCVEGQVPVEEEIDGEAVIDEPEPSVDSKTERKKRSAVDDIEWLYVADHEKDSSTTGRR